MPGRGTTKSRSSNAGRPGATAMPGRLLRAVFPPPRHRLRPRQILPLILFLSLFGAGYLLCTGRHWAVFTNVWPFLLLVFSPWVWWMYAAGRGGLTGWRGTVALLCRLLLLALVVLVLTEPRMVRETQGLALVYALDTSDSMGLKVADKALSYVLQTAGAKPQKDDAGLVVFGRDAAVELPPRASFPFEVINSQVARDGTDLAKGLALAGAIVPEDKQGRIVLISDGVQTDGQITRALEDLEVRNLAVDVLPVQYNFEDEVWIERLDLPRNVKTGETYEAVVLLSSLQAGSGTLVLQENGRTIAEQQVQYSSGKSRFTLPLYLREPGYYEYVAQIIPGPDADGWKENNTAINDLYLRGEGKVLLVTDSSGNTRDSERLIQAIRASRRQIDVVSSFDLPHDPMPLLPYDCVIFVNVPADDFDTIQQQALRDAVFNHGTGFLMVGGKNSFGPGGYHRTAVEEVLPVSMDVTRKKVLPKGALVIVLHTCEFPEGNVWAKRIAKEAIRVLSAKDDVGLLIYGMGGDKWVFPLTPASEYERLITLINQCTPADMPSFASIMTMGVTALEASDAAMKHMIIISDGDPSPPPPSLVTRFRDAGVSVSSVIINPHGGQDISMMRELAGITGGRYYRVDDPRRLPSIFIKEAKTLGRSMIQNKTFTPVIDFPSAVLKGIDRLPQLHGYVLVSPKERSTVILKSPETEEVEPVLSTWRFGLGKTAAFTSDLATNWGADWVGWEGYDAFVQQLLIDISRVERTTHLRVETFAAGSEGVVLVDDHHPDETLLELQVAVNGPRRRAVTCAMKQVGPRRYEGRFPLWGRGRYRTSVQATGGGRSETALEGFAVAYSPEYLRFRSDPIRLRRIAEQTGGRMLTGEESGEELFAVERTPTRTSQPIFSLLLALLVCLIPVDVGIRRVQLDWRAIRSLLGRKVKAESTPTLGALLKRKERVDEALTGKIKPPSGHRQGPGRPPPGARKGTTQLPEGQAQAEYPAKTVPAADDSEPLTTTERLLAMRRKRRQENSDDGST